LSSNDPSLLIIELLETMVDPINNAMQIKMIGTTSLFDFVI